MSNPINGYLVANNLANGNPTYPKPIIDTLILISNSLNFPNTISMIPLTHFVNQIEDHNLTIF